MECSLEHPVLELQLRLLSLRDLLFKIFRNFDLAAILNEPLNCFHILRKNEGVANVFGNPVLLSALQIIEDLLVVLFESLREQLLQGECHFTAATTAFDSFGLTDLSIEQLAIAWSTLLARSHTQAAPEGPAATFFLLLLLHNWRLIRLLALCVQLRVALAFFRASLVRRCRTGIVSSTLAAERSRIIFLGPAKLDSLAKVLDFAPMRVKIVWVHAIKRHFGQFLSIQTLQEVLLLRRCLLLERL